MMNVKLKLRQVTYNGSCEDCKIEECNLYAQFDIILMVWGVNFSVKVTYFHLF
jgi:hypothetical protein